MSASANSGKKAEEMARMFLERQGFQVLAVNWRHKHLELDIVGMDGDILVFVEVKARGKWDYVDVKSLLSRQKQSSLSRAATEYIQISDYHGEIRFDLITFIENKVNYIKDAFWNY